MAFAFFFSFSSICSAGASPARVLDSAAGAVAQQDFASHSWLDGFDCVTYELADEPVQVCANSPIPWNDLDEISLPSDDKAIIPSRDDQETPQFTTTTLDSIALRQPGFVPAFLFSHHSSNFLSEHLCERAPPSLSNI